MSERPKTYTPDYGITGPHQRRERRQWWLRFTALLLSVAAFIASILWLLDVVLCRYAPGC